jgi:hypothetical protein
MVWIVKETELDNPEKPIPVPREPNDPARDDLEDALQPLDVASTVFDDLRDDTINAIINKVADGVQKVSGYSEYWVNIDTPNHTQQFREGDTVAFQENVDTSTLADLVPSIIRDDPALNDYNEDVIREIAVQLVRAAKATTVEELPREPTRTLAALTVADTPSKTLRTSRTRNTVVTRGRCLRAGSSPAARFS